MLKIEVTTPSKLEEINGQRYCTMLQAKINIWQYL